jgi:ATP phosphoribosyltransferase
MLKIAIQKSGRLTEDTIAMLSDCGIKVRQVNNTLRQVVQGFNAEVLFLRDDDIPQYVEDGIADIGIVGENIMLDKAKNISLVKRLGYSKCRLSIAVPRNTTYENNQWLQGKKIATSYVKIVENYLTAHKITAEIHEISGSVEIAPSLGLADAIVDIVSSGSTLLSNGLIEAESILQSEAVIIGNKNLSTENELLVEKLLFRINAVLTARTKKYVLLNAPNNNVAAIVAILPGMKSPTVLPLAEAGWSSIHTVIDEEDFWNIIDQLKTLGAQGILVVPIEKMII